MRRRRRRSNVFVCLFVCSPFFTYCDAREEAPGINAEDRTAATGEKKRERRGIYTRSSSQALFSFTQLIHLSTPTTQMHYNTLTLRSRLSSISSIAVPGKDPPSSLGNKRFFFPSSFLFSKPTAAIRYFPTSNGLRTEEKSEPFKKEILPFNCKTNSKPPLPTTPVSQLFNVSFTGCKIWPVWMCPELNLTAHTMAECKRDAFQRL